MMSCECKCDQINAIAQLRAIALGKAIESLGDVLHSDLIVERAGKFEKFLLDGGKSEG
jgi:hypothetical protein